MFFGKEKKVAKKSKRGKIRNYISKKFILTQFLLLYPICNTQFNLWKTHVRVTGIKVITTKLGY